MKKYIKYLLTLILPVIGLSACVDDKGNYDYIPVEELLPVEVTGLKDTTFTVLSEVILKPGLKGLGNEDDYEFTWYCYPTLGNTTYTKIDTLGHEKDVSFFMRFPVGEQRVLVYEIKDKRTGYARQTKINIMSTSDFSSGWFLAKDENDETDLDYITTAGVVKENIFYAANGRKLSGKALKVLYQLNGYRYPVTQSDGSVIIVRNLSALYLLSDRDLAVLKTEDMSMYYDYDGFFYTAPDSQTPQDMFIPIHDSWERPDVYLLNAGRVHAIYGMSSNVGKVGYARVGYPNLFPGLIGYSSGNSSILAFDLTSRSFVTGNAYEVHLMPVLDPEPSGAIQIPAVNMNAELQWMQARNNGSAGVSAWAIMKSTTTPTKYFLADILAQGAQYPFVGYDEIPASSKLLQADVYGVHQLNSIYFAKGNTLSYYQKSGPYSDSHIKQIKAFPTGETISYIAQIMTEDAVPGFNQLIVLTNTGTDWKLYRFDLKGDGLSPEIIDNNQPFATGKGNARYVIYLE